RWKNRKNNGRGQRYSNGSHNHRNLTKILPLQAQHCACRGRSEPSFTKLTDIAQAAVATHFNLLLLWKMAS
ncbi:MAG: hypothetical protein KY428_06085, partial [Bacteroidetes bacterium]|nr:hypothetical protein [Bacteroidota bacterium]